MYYERLCSYRFRDIDQDDSFRGILPPSPALTRAYLRMPLAWRLLGKQFLVIGQKD